MCLNRWCASIPNLSSVIFVIALSVSSFPPFGKAFCAVIASWLAYFINVSLNALPGCALYCLQHPRNIFFAVGNLQSCCFFYSQLSSIACRSTRIAAPKRNINICRLHCKNTIFHQCIAIRLPLRATEPHYAQFHSTTLPYTHTYIETHFCLIVLVVVLNSID